MLSIEKKWKSSLFAHSALTFNELFKCYVFSFDMRYPCNGKAMVETLCKRHFQNF